MAFGRRLVCDRCRHCTSALFIPKFGLTLHRRERPELPIPPLLPYPSTLTLPLPLVFPFESVSIIVDERVDQDYRDELGFTDVHISVVRIRYRAGPQAGAGAGGVTPRSPRPGAGKDESSRGIFLSE